MSNSVSQDSSKMRPIRGWSNQGEIMGRHSKAASQHLFLSARSHFLPSCGDAPWRPPCNTSTVSKAIKRCSNSRTLKGFIRAVLSTRHISRGGWPLPGQPSQMAIDVKKVGEIPGRARTAMHNGSLKKGPSWRVLKWLKICVPCWARNHLSLLLFLCDEENRCWQFHGFTCWLAQLGLGWPNWNYPFWVQSCSSSISA